MKIGFANASLETCYPGDFPLADELKVCALAAEGKGGAGLFLVCDLGKLRRDVADRLRRTIAARLRLDAEQIGVAATQNHSALGTADKDRLEEAFVDAAAEAWATRTEAAMAHVAVVPEATLNFNRRHIDPELGAFTAWYGHAPTPDGGADISYLLHLDRQALMRGEIESPRATTVPLDQQQLPPDAPRVTLRPADDPLVQAVFFRTFDGKPIGSILRFTAHPVTAGGKVGKYRSGDFPVYARRRMTEVFGGAAMYVAGPCGDTAPCVPPTRSLELANGLGTRVADAALDHMTELAWRNRDEVRAYKHDITLTLRRDLPRDPAAAAAELEALARQIREQAAAGNLAAVKRLQERHETVNFWFKDQYPRWIPMPREQLAGASLEHQLFVLRLGECAILGLPGEPFSQYSVNIRQRTLGDNLLVSEQTNAGLGYIPTAEQFQYGGYGPSISAFDPAVEATLTHGAIAAVQKCMEPTG